MLPNNKPHTGQTVRDEDKENDEKAENDCTVLGKSENLNNKNWENRFMPCLSIFCRNLASLTSLVSLRISTEVKLAWGEIRMRCQNVLHVAFLTFHASRPSQLSENNAEN